MTRKEQEQIEAAIRKSLQDSQSSQPSGKPPGSAKAPSQQDPSIGEKDDVNETLVMDTPSTGGKKKPAVADCRCGIQSSAVPSFCNRTCRDIPSST